MLPQVSPHWLWGNTNFIELYKKMKGLRFCVWYTGRKRQLLVLDPDLINKITVTDFQHFVDVTFFDPNYSKVSYYNIYILVEVCLIINYIDILLCSNCNSKYFSGSYLSGVLIAQNLFSRFCIL